MENYLFSNKTKQIKNKIFICFDADDTPRTPDNNNKSTNIINVF